MLIQIENAGSSSGKKRIYLSIINGQLCYKVDKDTEGAILRKNKNGIDVYEKFVSGIIGLLKSVKPRDTDFGKTWEILLEDESNIYVLNIPYSSRYTNSFFLKIENANLNLPISIMIGKFISQEDNVERPYLTLKQGDVKLPYFYVKDDQRVPKPKKVLVNKKETWDESDRLDYYESIATKINNFISGEDVNSPQKPTSIYPEPNVESTSSVNQQMNNNDDLPF